MKIKYKVKEVTKQKQLWTGTSGNPTSNNLNYPFNGKAVTGCPHFLL